MIGNVEGSVAILAVQNVHPRVCSQL